MKLKPNSDNLIPYRMAAGKDVVSGVMPIGEAERIFREGRPKVSRKYRDYPICVNDTYYFPGEVEKKGRHA